MTQQALAAQNRACFQMTHITRSAIQHALALDPVHQRAVIDHLLEPQAACDCTPVHGRPGVRHFRVNNSIRVSFVRRSERVVVVHVGLHPDFNKFAQPGKGAPSVSSAISIEEFVMKAEAAPRTSSNSRARAAQPSNPVVGGLVAAFSQTIEQQMKMLRDDALVECFFEITAARLEQRIHDSLETFTATTKLPQSSEAPLELAKLEASIAEQSVRASHHSDRLASLEAKLSETQQANFTLANLFSEAVANVRSEAEQVRAQLAPLVEARFQPPISMMHTVLKNIAPKLAPREPSLPLAQKLCAYAALLVKKSVQLCATGWRCRKSDPAPTAHIQQMEHSR